MKWYHVYIDGTFVETVKARNPDTLCRKWRHSAKRQVNVINHETQEETMLGLATTTAKVDVLKRLEYLRGELRAERISYAELAELQSLSDHIPIDDMELREAAGLPERSA